MVRLEKSPEKLERLFACGSVTILMTQLILWPVNEPEINSPSSNN